MEQPSPSLPRPHLTLPTGQRLLLHVCCAPCSGDMMEALQASGIETTLFYYNPNVHPQEEYEKRKAENKRFAEKLGMPFIDADYDVDNWLERIRGFEAEPERGKRCTICFSLRLEGTARYAQENGFPVFATSLGLSRHKNQAQVYACGHAAAARHEGVVFWDYNWREKGGEARAQAVARREGFYRQNYCGCRFSQAAREAHDAAKKADPQEKG